MPASTNGPGWEPVEAARVELPTPHGIFQARAFDRSGFVYLALVYGDLGDGEDVLTRVHSECLTGDALESLRCDCGLQLRASLRAISSEGRGLLVYATGHEGRGIGLLNKLRAYVAQETGVDTVDANLHLGLPVDGRDYSDSAAVIKAVGVRSVELMTNNPHKVDALQASGINVHAVRQVPVAPHTRNRRYIATKQLRLGHGRVVGNGLVGVSERPPDVERLLGPIRVGSDRPYVVIKYAQSLDGRIATTSGDSKWISGRPERVVSHALRARCDAIMVGAGTVVNDDPQLTVRMVAGASPLRVVLDSTLRSPLDAQIFDGGASTLVITTERADPIKLRLLRERYIGVRVVESGPRGIDMRNALRLLNDIGVRTLIVEGGAGVITSMLAERVADRVVVAVAPLFLGTGTEAVGNLDVRYVTDGIGLRNRSVHIAGNDVIIAGDLSPEPLPPE
jgi:GTP cyclohydrolase II